MGDVGPQCDIAVDRLSRPRYQDSSCHGNGSKNPEGHGREEDRTRSDGEDGRRQVINS